MSPTAGNCNDDDLEILESHFSTMKEAENIGGSKDCAMSGLSTTLYRSNTDRTLIPPAPSSCSDEDEVEKEIRQWKENPFAVGCTKATWEDENIGCYELCESLCWNRSRQSHIHCTACICNRIGAKRVGNMVVLRQRVGDVVDDDDDCTTAEELKARRPKLLCVTGPYWFVMFFLTIPTFLALSLLVGFVKIPYMPLPVLITWAMLNAGLFVSLCFVSLTDPGVLYRYKRDPTLNKREDNKESSDGRGKWTWNDQALTYRPANALYDPECAVVVEDFDHTCLLTGTAIGKNNIKWFRLFVFFSALTLTYNVVLLAWRT